MRATKNGAHAVFFVSKSIAMTFVSGCGFVHSDEKRRISSSSPAAAFLPAHATLARDGCSGSELRHQSRTSLP